MSKVVFLNKKINASEKSLREIEATLDEVQGKAKVRTLDYFTIENTLHAVEKFYGVKDENSYYRRMPKSKFVGTEVTYYEGAMNYPRAYKYDPVGTGFKAVYTKKGWVIDCIFRESVNHGNAITVKLPDTAKDFIIDREQTALRLIPITAF